jgi:hypothetical protein
MIEFLFIIAILYLIIAPSARYRYRQVDDKMADDYEPPSSSLNPPSNIDEIERYANKGR